MPNGLEPVNKEDLEKIQESIRAALYSVTLGHLAKAKTATPDLKFQVTGYTVGTNLIRIDILRRQDGNQG